MILNVRVLLTLRLRNASPSIIIYESLYGDFKGFYPVAEMMSYSILNGGSTQGGNNIFVQLVPGLINYLFCAIENSLTRPLRGNELICCVTSKESF